MMGSTSETRRRFVGFLGALPVSLLSTRSQAQARQLELASYYHPARAALAARAPQLFVDRVSENSQGALEVSCELAAGTMLFRAKGTMPALAHYYAPEFASFEPVVRLSALPMLAATFEEAETLLRIGRPYYESALARHGQILLATEPWRPGVLWSVRPIRSAADLADVSFALSSHAGQAGWGTILTRLGARYDHADTDTELMLAAGDAAIVKFARQYSCLTEIFCAAPLNFLTADRAVFDTLTEAQRQILVVSGRDTELALWKLNRELVQSDHLDIAAQGVTIAPQAPADLVAALRTAAEPEIQRWAVSMGADGATILTDYRRAIGHG